MTNDRMRGYALGVGLAIAGLSLGGGVGLAGAALGGAFVEAKAPKRIVAVKGLSERLVDADAASWRLPFRGQGGDRAQAVAEAIRAQGVVIELGRAGGFSDEEITLEPFALTLERSFIQTAPGKQEERLRYVASGAIRFRTDDVAKMAAMTGETARLLDQNVLIGATDYEAAPRALYAFTSVATLKPEMIAEATRNARAAAQRFAEDSASRVGRIASANQGVVQIFAADGDYDERHERRKRVRVVSTVRYELTD